MMSVGDAEKMGGEDIHKFESVGDDASATLAKVRSKGDPWTRRVVFFINDKNVVRATTGVIYP